MTPNEKAKESLNYYLSWAQKNKPVYNEQERRDECLKNFKKKNEKQLNELVKRAENHEILFCAKGWTGCIGYPFIMTFDFEIAFDYAFAYAIRNPNANLARLEYYEIGGGNHNGRPEFFAYLGL